MKQFKRALCIICGVALLISMLSACGSDDSNKSSRRKEKHRDTDTVGSYDLSSLEGISLPYDTNSASKTQQSTNSATLSHSDDVNINVPSNECGGFPPFDPYENIQYAAGTTVRFATWIDHTTTEGAVPLANLEADTGLKVELYMVKQGGYVSTLMTKMASGDIPDVFVSNEGDGCFPMTLQIAAPINKVSTVDLKDPIWDQTLLKTATIDGNVYLVNTIGTPWSGPNLVFYNKAIFEENGIKTPEEYYEEGKWTWNNLLKCAKDIKALGADYKGIMLESNTLTDSLGTSFIKYDYKTGVFSNGIKDKALVEGYKWYADARTQGLLDGSFEAFNANKCGLIIRGPYGLKATGYFMNMNTMDVGFTYLPSMYEGQKSRTSSIYRMYGICDKAPNGDAAGYFIRYWLDPANYDINHTFLTKAAGNFYYELLNQSADNKYFCFDKPCANLIGEEVGIFWSPVRNAAVSGVENAINSVSGKVDQAVNKANKLIADKIEADRRYYN